MTKIYFLISSVCASIHTGNSKQGGAWRLSARTGSSIFHYHSKHPAIYTIPIVSSMLTGLYFLRGTGVAFPKNFRDTVKTIVRRLFRVYAHIYSNHFDHVCALGIEGAFLFISYMRFQMWAAAFGRFWDFLPGICALIVLIWSCGLWHPIVYLC